jgi:transposase-like protein
MRKVYILNFTPKYCPQCGKEMTWKQSDIQDWQAQCSHTCKPCGTKFQYVTGEKIVKLASINGDMEQYLEY